MASFDEHLNQAKKNLDFLQSINSSVPNCHDWQVTVAFYSALHLMNAYVVERMKLHYRRHEDINNALNFLNATSPIRLSQDNYLAYRKLQGWARRARYLCHDESGKDEPERAFFTYDKHVSKAIKKLDVLIDFFVGYYSSTTIPKHKIICPDLKGATLKYFENT